MEKYIKQLSVFVENKDGRLAAITAALADNKINISALSIADTTDFGILRLIADKPEEAVNVLRSIGVTAKITKVLAVAMNDEPGGLSDIIKAISEAGLTIEYMYAFVGKIKGRAVLVIRVNDPEKVLGILEKSGITVLSDSEVCDL